MLAEFQNLMDAISIRYDIENPKMEGYWFDPDWLLEPIVDGRRVQCLIDEDNHIKFAGKRLNERLSFNLEEKIPCLNKELQTFKLYDTLLDGYLFYNSYEDTIRFINANPRETTRMLEQSNVKFIITDVICHKREEICNCSLYERNDRLHEIFSSNGKHFELTTLYHDDKRKIYNLMIQHDYFIFKLGDSPYFLEGKASQYWRGLTRQKKYFVVILDITEGTGRNQGLCKALKVGQYRDNKIIPLGDVAGIDHDYGYTMFRNREDFIGKVIEIKTAGRSINAFYEGFFLRLCPDMKPEECIFTSF